MPPLPQTGVEYVGRGFDRWIRDLAKSVKAISEHEKFTRNDALALSMLTEAANKAVTAQSKYASGYLKAAKAASQATKDQQKVHEQATKEAIDNMTNEVSFQMKHTKDMSREAEKQADAQIKASERAAKAVEANAQRTASAAISMAAGAGSGGLGGLGSAIGGAIGGPGGLLLQNLGSILKIAAWANPITGPFLALGSALKTVGTIAGAIIKPVGDVINTLAQIGGAVISTGINVAKSALQALGAVINALLTPVRWLGEQIRQVFVVTIGILLRDAVRSAMQAIQELINMIFEGGTSMQIMQIRLQGMMATEIQSTDATISFADALKAAVQPATELIDWINVLAVKSPFERGTIADTVALGMALDFSSEQAKKITSALVDWASGMGLEGDAITRILYNFGQMRAQGKLTGQELRDAARGGLIPVMDILRQLGTEAGATGAKLEAMIHDPAQNFTGSQVDRFFQLFIEMAEKRFPNAAERMSRTWSGVTNNIKDFIKTVLGADVLTPVLDKIAGKMADFLNQMLTPQVRQNFKAIGESLSYAFDVIYPAIQRAIASVQEFAKALGLPKIDAYSLAATIEIVADNIAKWLDTASGKVRDFATKTSNYFENLSTNALAYGANTAIQWANGFIQGITTAVVGALNALSQMLEGWLKGMSPPKIVPHIGEWGAHTFEEWLKGFKDADFGVLESVGGAVNNALGALVKLGRIDEGDFGSIYGGLLKGLAKGISAGGFSESFLKKLKSQLGEFGGAVVKLLKDQMAYAQATNAAAAAEKALADAQKASSAQRVKVNGLIKDYNTALRGGSSRDQLGQKLSVINAEEKTLQVQQDQVTVAQQAAQDAKDKADALKEAAALQEKVIDQLINFGNTFALPALDTTEITGALGGVNSALAETGDYFNKTGIELDKFKLKNGEAAESIGEKLGEAKTSVGKILEALSLQWTIFYDANFNPASPTSRIGSILRSFDIFSGKAGELKDKLLEKWGLMGIDLQTFYTEHIDPQNKHSEVGRILDAFQQWYDKLKPIGQWFADNKDGIGIAMGLIWTGIKAVIWLIIEPFRIWFEILQKIADAIKWINEHPVKVTGPSSGNYGQCGAGMYWDGSKCVKENNQAAGGPVSGGQPYVVGERGWEYFVPNVSGYIIPNNLSSAITRVLQQRRDSITMSRSGMVASAPMMSSGKTVNIIFEQVAINNGMDLAQLEAVIHRTVVKDL